MKIFGLSLLAMTSVVAVAAAAPASIAPEGQRLAIANPEISAQIVLPDRRVCTYVGPQPRSLGDPVTYTCTDGRGLRGSVRIDSNSYMTVDREGPENRDRDAIVESQDIRFLIEEIVLADGTVCRHAGFGATLAFGGKRLSHSCGHNAGLIGDINMQAGGVFQVEKAELNGTELVSSEVTPIRRLGRAR